MEPNGELPIMALDRLKGLGQWMHTYGQTLYGTDAGPVKPCTWGATTERNDTVFVHIFKKLIYNTFRLKKGLQSHDYKPLYFLIAYTLLL